MAHKHWILEFMNPPEGAEHRFTVETAALKVGRSGAATDFRIDWDRKISRSHAIFKAGPGDKLTLTDLDSTNGTFILDDQKKWQEIKGTVPLTCPAVVKLADTAISVYYGDKESEADLSLYQSQVMALSDTMQGLKKREALLVLDQCGSTALPGMEGETMALHLKKRIFQLCDLTFQDGQPDHMKNTGDGIFATFANPAHALERAVEILRKIAHRNRLTRNPPIRVRIGLHFGETFIMDSKSGERHGNHVNIAFRLEGVQSSAIEPPPATPLPDENRILASSEFVIALNNAAAPFTPLGSARLKGIDEPISLLLWQGILG